MKKIIFIALIILTGCIKKDEVILVHYNCKTFKVPPTATIRIMNGETNVTYTRLSDSMIEWYADDNKSLSIYITSFLNEMYIDLTATYPDATVKTYHITQTSDYTIKWQK